MKKYLVLFLTVVSIGLTSCSKDDDNINTFTKEQLRGIWKLSDVIRPDGKKGNDLDGLEKKAIECQREKFKLGFKDNLMLLATVTPMINNGYLDCGSNYTQGEGKFKISGNAISVLDEDSGNYKDAFIVVSLTGKILTIKYSEELKKLSIKNYYQNTGSYEYISGYSIKDAMNSTLVLEKIKEL